MNPDNLIRSALEKGAITERHVSFLDGLAPPDAVLVLARLVLPLRMNANTTRDVAGMLDGVSRRDGVKIETLISAPPFADILVSEAGAKKTKEDFIAELRRQRYPEYSRIEDAFNSIANRIRAEGGIDVKAPKNLEGNRLTFNLAAKSPDELAALLGRLRAALDSGDIGKLFMLLGSIEPEL
ncbi:MAG: hypothetical protein ACYS8W_11300 [Planctomycetota bacterium]